MTEEEMDGRTRLIERVALLQEVKSDRGKGEKMEPKNQSVVVEPVWPILDSRLSTSKHPLTTSRRGVRTRIRAHAHTRECMYTYAGRDGYPSRGISPSASAISRFQATVLIRPQTSLPLLRPNAQPMMPNAHRQIVKNFILQTHALLARRTFYMFKARNVRWRNGEIPNASSESRSQRCAWTGAILGKRDAAREQQVKVSLPRNVVGNHVRCALSRFPVRCFHPV